MYIYAAATSMSVVCPVLTRRIGLLCRLTVLVVYCTYHTPLIAQLRVRPFTGTGTVALQSVPVL